jgi:hypothetical protein
MHIRKGVESCLVKSSRPTTSNCPRLTVAGAPRARRVHEDDPRDSRRPLYRTAMSPGGTSNDTRVTNGNDRPIPLDSSSYALTQSHSHRCSACNRAHRGHRGKRGAAVCKRIPIPTLLLPRRSIEHLYPAPQRALSSLPASTSNSNNNNRAAASQTDSEEQKHMG